MNELIVEVFHGELFGSRTNVAVLVPISFLIAVDAGNEYVRTNVKFSFLV